MKRACLLLFVQGLVLVSVATPGLLRAQPAGRGRQPLEADEMIRVRNLTALGSRAVVPTPIFNTSAGRGLRSPQDWHVVTLQYDVVPEWIDEMVVQFYVLSMMRDPETGGNAYSLFRKTVAYLDIERGRDRRALAFLRPAGLKRFGRVVACAAIVSIGGQVAAAPNESNVDLPENWWENPVVLDSPALTIRDGYLLDRKETPWAFINYDDYEFIR